MNKGIIYSMDTVFAIYVILLSISTFTILYEYQASFGEQDLELSRIATDAYNIVSEYPDAEFPDNLKFGRYCDGNSFTGHAFRIEPENGRPVSKDFVVCLDE